MKTLEFSQNLDGHSVRAAAFFMDELEDLGATIDIDSVESVNSIKKLYPDLRQKAKAPSFALQYSGTWVTIQKTLGCSEAKAKQIEESYHQLYSGLAEFAENNKKFAMQNGYVECAFGLKLRTPLLYAEKGSGKLSSIAGAEARSSNNATTQSYGLLMNRTTNEFINVVNNSKYVNDVRAFNVIHDCFYALVRNDAEVIKFVNDELIRCMEWQDDDKLRSDEVLLGAELDIGPDWAHQYTLKNNATLDEVEDFTSRVNCTTEFLKLAKEKFGDTYDYSKVFCRNFSDTVDIVCKIHGTFKQTPAEHLDSSGCAKCN